MAKFFYIARDQTGKKISGFEEAANSDELVTRLQAKGLLVLNISSEYKEGPEFKPEVAGKVKLRRRHYGVRSEDLVLFCRQLATLLGAGVTILNSLNIISQQVSSVRLKNILKDLTKSLEGGLSFHEALGKHADVFSELWINLIESGEASGNLASILNRLATYLERLASFRQKIISALIYPVILMIVGTAAFIFFAIKIIPTFAEIFEGFEMKLPLLTRLLILVSLILRKYFLILAGAILFGIFLFRRYISTNTGRRNFEAFLFKLPVFGDFFHIVIMERFTSEMSTLVESGVPILYSLEITEHSVANLVAADIIRKIKEQVREGKPLSQPVSESGFFEPMAIQMIAIGEEIGELSNMLKRLNAFYQEYVETFLTRFTAMFEPIMLVLMGIGIGIMVIGMFLPIFQLARVGG